LIIVDFSGSHAFYLINVKNNVLYMQEFDVSRILLPYFQRFFYCREN